MDKNENLHKGIIYQNSIIRSLLIEKEEYILFYKHPKIIVDNSELNKTEFGKIILITKNIQKDKKYYQYESSSKLRIGDCLNEKILKSDDLLLTKIINILEGSHNLSETLKLEKTSNEKIFCFKIQLNIKNGISLVIFNTNMEKSVLSDFHNVFSYCSYFFKKKLVKKSLIKEIKEEMNKECLENIKSSESAVNKLIKLNQEKDVEKNNLLQQLASLLNDKKKEIIALKKKIDREDEEEEEIKMSQYPHIPNTFDIICRREMIDEENNGNIDEEPNMIEENNISSKKNERLSLEDLL